MPRLRPLDRDEMPEFEELFVDADRRGREVPNLLRTLARKPEIMKAARALRAAVLAPGLVSDELKNMISQIASKGAGCSYCAAHTATFGIDLGIAPEKASALWDFERSALFDDAERAALKVALGAAQVPNAVTDEDFDELKNHFTDEQIVELLSVVGVFGFYNRMNDTLATELESVPVATAQKYLGPQGWELGKHAKSED